MRKILFLIPIFLFLFIPKNAFALTDRIKPLYAEYWNFSGDHYSNSNLVLKYQNNYDFNGFGAPNTINRILYTMPTPANWNGKTNDYSFILWQPNLSLASLNGNSGAQPIVYLNGAICDVYGTWSTSETTATWSQAFAVKCTHVKIEQDNFGVNVITPPLKYDAGLYNDFYGISDNWAYTPYDSNDDVLKELKEQTTEQKKQTEEQKKQTEELKKQTEEQKKQTDTIKDSDTSDASNSANSFFDGFEDNNYGLSDIVTMPLEFIKGMSSSTCNSLEFPVPFVNQNVKLACMSSIYKKHFSAFLSLYQVITTGLIAYWCCVNMFRLVQNFKNPDNDEVEVLDL